MRPKAARARNRRASLTPALAGSLVQGEMESRLWAHADCGTLSLSTEDHEGWEFLVIECPVHAEVLFSIKGMPEGIRRRYWLDARRALPKPSGSDR